MTIPELRYIKKSQCEIHEVDEVEMNSNSIMQRCSKCDEAIMNLVGLQ